MCVASLISLAIYVYTPYFAKLVGIFGFILTFGLTSIAAMVMPLRARTIFETSPVRWRIFGMPVISILGVVSLIMCGFMEWIFLSDPNAGLLSTTAPFFSQIPYGMAWFNYYSVTDIDPGMCISYRLVDGTLAGANEITFLMPPVLPSSTS